MTVLPLVASLLTGNQLQAAERQVSDRNRDFTAALTDCLSGFTVVKTFKAEKEIFSLFAENNRALEGEKFSRRRLKVLVGMIGALSAGMATSAAKTAVDFPAVKSSESPSPGAFLRSPPSCWPTR